MNRPRFALYIGCLISLMMVAQGLRMEQARAATPPALSWHVGPGDEFVYLYFYTSPQVGSVQSMYIKYRIAEINNTAFSAGVETYYRDVVWASVYTWTGGQWLDATSGQHVALTTANQTWQAFCVFIQGKYYAVTGYPRACLETNSSQAWLQPQGVFLPEMPHGGGLYNMSQYNQSFFTSTEAKTPGSYDPQYSSLSDTGNWWQFDNGTFFESRKWTSNGAMFEWTRKLPGFAEMYYYLIDAPGYHRNYWTTPFGFAASEQWGVARDQRYVWKNNTSGNYVRYTIDGFQNYSMPNLELLFATKGYYATAEKTWAVMPGPVAIAGANLTDRAFTTTWGSETGQSTHFLGGPQFATALPLVFELAWVIPVPLNLTRLNETFFYVREGLDDDLTLATAVVNGNNLTITNNSVDVVSWTYTSGGVMRSFINRNWTEGSVIYNFSLVEGSPGISLKPGSTTKIPIGELVKLAVTDTNGEGIAWGKYAFSSSASPPSNWDLASALPSSHEIAMPEGDFGNVYLHVLVEDALGFQDLQTFALERLTSGNIGPTTTWCWVIGGALAAAGIDISIKRRKSRVTMSP